MQPNTWQTIDPKAKGVYNPNMIARSTALSPTGAQGLLPNATNPFKLPDWATPVVTSASAAKDNKQSVGNFILDEQNKILDQKNNVTAVQQQKDAQKVIADTTAQQQKQTDTATQMEKDKLTALTGDTTGGDIVANLPAGTTALGEINGKQQYTDAQGNTYIRNEYNKGTPNYRMDYTLIKKGGDAKTTQSGSQAYNLQTREGLFDKPSDPTAIYDTTPAPTGYKYMYDAKNNRVTVPTTQIEDANAKLEKAASDLNAKADQILNGTYPLNPDQQAQLDALKKDFEGLIAEQKVTNANYEGVIGRANQLSGEARYSPDLAAGRVVDAVTKGTQKISSLQSKMAASLAAMKQGFMSDDFEIMKTAYETYTGAQKDIQKNLDTMRKEATDEINRARDAQTKVTTEIESNRSDILKALGESGAPADVIAAVSNAKSVGDMIKSSGSYLEKATGTAGEYLLYKRDAVARGQTPMDPNSYFTIDANRKARVAAAASNPDRILSATEAQALKVPFGTTASQAYGKEVTKPPTEGQSNAAMYAMRINSSIPTIESLQDEVVKMNSAAFLAQITAEDTTIGNAFVSDTIKQLRQAERDFGTALLRRESGATISPTEFSTQSKQYFPRPGDDAVTLAQKKKSRENALNGMIKASGPAYGAEESIPTAGDMETQAEQSLATYLTNNKDQATTVKTQIATMEQTLGRPITSSEFLEAYPEYK